MRWPGGLRSGARRNGVSGRTGSIAIALAIAALAALFISIIGNGYTAFQQTFIELEVTYDPEVLGIGEDSGFEGAVGRELPGAGQEDDAGHVPGR